MPIDRDDYNARAARINMMLEELRLNTEDLHPLAKQATDRSWDAVWAARVQADDVRVQCDFPLKKAREP